MSYFTEFAQLLKEGEIEINGRFRELFERIAEILDEHEDRIKKLEEKLEI